MSEKFSLCKSTHFNDPFERSINAKLMFVSGSDSGHGSLMTSLTRLSGVTGVPSSAALLSGDQRTDMK